MYITDFMFDDIWLSDFGYQVCSFGKATQSEISNGANIEFKTTSIRNGELSLLAKSIYPEVITATLQICKQMCVNDYNPIMSVADISKLTAWLCQKQFCDLIVNDPEFYDETHPENTIFFTGSFAKVSRVEFGGNTIGLTLEFISNAPFAHKPPVETTLTFTEAGTQTLSIVSDYVGDFYPSHMEITMPDEIEPETLELSTSISDMTIENCEANEILYITYPIITSSSRSQSNLASAFNYDFLKLYSGLGDSTDNAIHSSIPCEVRIEYNPVVNISI